MSQTVVLWSLGGWFVVSACVAVVMGKLSSLEPLADASDAVRTPAPAERPADREVRSRIAA
jgi:hypothetical protein